MKIFQRAELSSDPVGPMDAVTKQYVDSVVGTGIVFGGLFFVDVTPTASGIVGLKDYVAGTVPANKVIEEATTDTENIRVHLIAEGAGAFYSPTVTITTVPALTGTPTTVTLAEDPSDKRFFIGHIDLQGVTANTVITATSSTNAVAILDIIKSGAAPSADTVLIGALPGAQTEVKQGDVVQISGRVANSAAGVEVVVGGAAGAVTQLVLDAPDSYSSGYRAFTGTFTVGNGTGSQKVSVRAKNLLGTFGATVQSTNNVTLNQTKPTIGTISIAYPATQNALKGSETATVSSTITNADTVAYSSSADLSVADASTYAVGKIVTRIDGNYVVGTNNYTITANKASNGSQTVVSAAVAIANVAPTASISINGSPSRLASSASGVDYVVRITPTQALIVAPTLVASSGSWQGSWTANAGGWIRTLRVRDTDVKGVNAFSTLVLTSLSRMTGSTITAGSAYTVGGFGSRTIIFPAFARFAPIGTNVVDFNKVTALYTGAGTLTRQASTAELFAGFTIVDASGNYDPQGGYIFLTDSAFAGSNTTGTLKVDVAEAQ